jgi:hypothetical protein
VDGASVADEEGARAPRAAVGAPQAIVKALHEVRISRCVFPGMRRDKAALVGKHGSDGREDAR